MPFHHGRITNAVAESYFEIVKESVLQKKTRLRPTNFLIEMHLHIQSRFKGANHGVSQYSKIRKNKKNEQHPLNVKETWLRRIQSTATDKRRGRYFDENATETRAHKISYVFFFPVDYVDAIILIRTKPNARDGMRKENQLSTDTTRAQNSIFTESTEE